MHILRERKRGWCCPCPRRSAWSWASRRRACLRARQWWLQARWPKNSGKVWETIVDQPSSRHSRHGTQHPWVFPQGTWPPRCTGPLWRSISRRRLREISSCWQRPKPTLELVIEQFNTGILSCWMRVKFPSVYLEFLLELVSLGLSKLSTLLSLLNVSLDEDQFASDFFVP